METDPEAPDGWERASFDGERPAVYYNDERTLKALVTPVETSQGETYQVTFYVSEEAHDGYKRREGSKMSRTVEEVRDRLTERYEPE